MVAHDVSTCALVDDQVAIVPRELAPAFFMQHAREIMELNGTGMHGVGTKDIDTAAMAVAVSEKEAAVLKSSDLNNTAGDIISQVCCAIILAKPLQADGLLDRSCGSSSFFDKLEGPSNRRFSIDHSKCIAENCLTMRLYNRQVPFKISPFGCALFKVINEVRRYDGACMSASPERKCARSC